MVLKLQVQGEFLQTWQFFENILDNSLAIPIPIELKTPIKQEKRSAASDSICEKFLFL